MAIYTFSFDSKYAGHTATITDEDEVEVAGSPVTLDDNGDGQIAISSGTYRAQVDNSVGAFGDGYSVVDGVYDIEASIAAAGSGLAISDSYLFEINNGATLTPAGSFTSLTWDTAPEGYTGSMTFLALPAGSYYAAVELDFAQPAEDRAISIGFLGGLNQATGPLPIYSTGDTFGHIAYTSGVVILNDVELFTGVNVTRAVIGANGSPADLAITYGALTLTRIN